MNKSIYHKRITVVSPLIYKERYNLCRHELQQFIIILVLGWIVGGCEYQENIALIVEYYYLFPNQLSEDITPSLSIGVDIKTGGHIFQLHLSNSRGMTENQFVTDTTGIWNQGDIHFGFNMSRIFKLKGRWY